MSETSILAIIICSACFLMLLVFAVVYILLRARHKEQLETLAASRYAIDLNAAIDRSITDLLNYIIDETFSDYKLKFLIPMNEGYINSDREAEIRKDLTRAVVSRLSDATLNKLYLLYNKSNISDVIADKIYIVVMNYVLDHNNGKI